MATATRTRKPSAPAERLIAEVLKAQDAFFAAAKRPSEEFLTRALDLPQDFDPLDVEMIRDAQMAYQAEFKRRSAERLRLGVRRAMAEPTRLTLIRALRARQRDTTDPDVIVRLENQVARVREEPDPRRQAVLNLLESERRLAQAHAAAMAGRAKAASRGVQVRSESPTGAFWERDPTSDSCEECRFLDGKLWPWEVLEQIGPPRHPQCRCRLIPVGAARYRGLVGPRTKVPTAKQGVHRARRLLQETIVGAILVEACDRGLLTEDWREDQHQRDRYGRFDDKGLLAAVGRRIAPPVRDYETTLAKGFKEAAALEGKAYADKMIRDTEVALAQMTPEWASSPMDSDWQAIDTGIIEISKVEWDYEGSQRVIVTNRMLDSGGYKVFNPDAPDVVEQVSAWAREAATKAAEATVPAARKRLRGKIESPNHEDGRIVYDHLDEANAENDANSRYSALRQRFRSVPDKQIVISEVGMGPGTGITDVFTAASRNLHSGVTSINGFSILFDAKKGKEMLGDSWLTGPGSREQQFKPGVDHITLRDTSGLIRHEWGHGLYHALDPEQREEFRSMLPSDDDGAIDWVQVSAGLSKYAAGDPSTRESYVKNTAMLDYAYDTETFAEAVALVGAADYYPAMWPGWVNRVADWIEKLEP
jgi:hypothetical protein